MAISDEQNQDSMLGLSDAEIANMNPADFDDVQDEDTGSDDTAQDQDESTEDAAATAEADDGGESDDTDTEDDADDTDGSDDAEGDGDSEDTAEDDESSDDDSDSDADSEDDEDTEDESEKDTNEIDYKAEYEKLMAPFRANGKEMQVKSAEEVRQLMQMGANYNKKMAGLKPNLKMMKMLENNGLLDEGKINELIDLKKGNPQAIQKLMKDSNVDPLEFEEGKESEYKPNTYNVDEREVELDSVLDEIQDTPSYSDTINVVSNKWDSDSKQTIAENPQVLKVINDHMASGIYEQISKEVERERAFGRLNGVSDLDAYKQVGDRLDSEGAFASVGPQKSNQAAPQKKNLGTKKVDRSKKNDDSKTKQQKRAASSTRASSTSNKSQEDFNPLAMSDEEIAKMTNQSFM